MAPHSSTLAWRIQWTEEPGRLQSMGLLRVGHDRATSLSLFSFMHWRKKCQPTPVFLSGESQGRGSLVGCHLWGRTESDTSEVTQQQQQQRFIVYIYHSFFIYSSVDGHLGCFHVLAIVNSAAVNTGVHVSFSILFSSGHTPRNGIVGGFIPPMPMIMMLLLLLSRFSRVRLCATSQTAAHQAPPSLGFSRQEHWSGQPFPSPMHESEK